MDLDIDEQQLVAEFRALSPAGRQELLKLATGLLRPRYGVPGFDLAGEVEALDAELGRLERFLDLVDQAHEAEFPQPTTVPSANFSVMAWGWLGSKVASLTWAYPTRGPMAA